MTTDPGARWELQLRECKVWPSFEQFRIDGAKGVVECISEGGFGVLRIKGEEFAIVRRRDFGRLMGMAQDVRRMTKGVLLMKQAAELVFKSSDQELAVRHLNELSLSFPDVVTTGPTDYGEFTIGQDEGVSIDVDTYVPLRPSLSTG
jgi:hypothetical protein